MPIYKLRVLEKTEDGGVIKLTGVDYDAPTLTSNATGGSTSVPTPNEPVLTLRGPTSLEVLDLPLLTSADGTAGLFIAAGSVLDNWPGAVIYRSTDGGVTFDDIGTLNERAIIGTAETRLYDWAGGNTLDNCNSVIVSVHGGDLASCTFERLLEGDNLCALGGELLQFRTATQLTPGRWLLTDFLRYRSGTERFTGLHVPGERFVLIDPAAIVPIESNLRGRQVIYRAVTVGSPVTAGTDVTVTETHEALRPLAPLHLNVAAVGTSYVAKWVRRTRVPAPWLDGSDAPVDDAPLQFRVRAWFDNFDLINAVVGVPEITFGTGLALANYRLEVTQLSSSGADGYAATAIIP